MAQTITKLTEQQQRELDEYIVNDLWLDDDGYKKHDTEVELGGVLFCIEYETDRESWSLNNGTYDYPCDYEVRMDYRVNALYYYDEETDERIDVACEREDWYRIY